MPKRPPTYRGPRPTARPPDNRESSCKRGYGHGWRQFREQYLAANPLCLDCKERGRIVGASQVDHVRTIRSGADLYDEDNLRPLCASCHSRKTARFDRRPGKPGVGVGRISGSLTP